MPLQSPRFRPGTQIPGCPVELDILDLPGIVAAAPRASSSSRATRDSRAKITRIVVYYEKTEYAAAALSSADAVALQDANLRAWLARAPCPVLFKADYVSKALVQSQYRTVKDPMPRHRKRRRAVLRDSVVPIAACLTPVLADDASATDAPATRSVECEPTAATATATGAPAATPTSSHRVLTPRTRSSKRKRNDADASAAAPASKRHKPNVAVQVADAMSVAPVVSDESTHAADTREFDMAGLSAFFELVRTALSQSAAPEEATPNVACSAPVSVSAVHRSTLHEKERACSKLDAPESPCSSECTLSDAASHSADAFSTSSSPPMPLPPMSAMVVADTRNGPFRGGATAPTLLARHDFTRPEPISFTVAPEFVAFFQATSSAERAPLTGASRARAVKMRA